MENIRITVLSVLFLSAAVYLADMLISGTGMEKTVRYNRTDGCLYSCYPFI